MLVGFVVEEVALEQVFLLSTSVFLCQYRSNNAVHSTSLFPVRSTRGGGGPWNLLIN